MLFTPLGHTEFLIDIENNEGKNIRFLIDTWLSDYAVGDLMERGTHVTLDSESLRSIDYIYISHTHTDHLDPYTLVEIYHHASPTLILPVTLRYLESVFTEYLGSIEIIWLENRKSITLSGIEVTGIMFDQDEITNEDDVMCLALASDIEMIFAEIDTVPPETEEANRILAKIFNKREYTTRAYIASRNELEGNLKILDLDSPRARENFRREYVASRRELIEWGYDQWQYEESASLENLFLLPGFVRGFIGQGIVYPRLISPALAGLTALSLEEVVDRENSYMEQYGYNFSQKALLPGRQYRLEGGVIETGRKECPIGTLSPLREKTPIDTPDTRIYVAGPLFSLESWTRDRELQILALLQDRFLPYWSASPIASLRSHLISKSSSDLVIAIEGVDGVRYFRYGVDSRTFECGESYDGTIDEHYFLGDILDFLEGRQDLYSNFWHKLDPKKVYRLWTCLGANFMNHDLVMKKYQYHFARAKCGETSASFFEEMTKRLPL